MGACRLQLHLPGCASLKEKRSRLKPLLARLRREFEAAAAEIEWQDVWQTAGVAVVLVANDANFLQSRLAQIPTWVEHYWPDVDVQTFQIELR
jgi:hypothetical protein